MTSPFRSPTRPTLGRWVFATAVGWIVAIPLIMLLAAISEGLGVGNQYAVGLGAGLSVGFAQWRVGRRWFALGPGWLASSAVGMALPFIVADLIRVDWSGDSRMLLLSIVAAGALLTGTWQRRLLRPLTARSDWWPAASVLGWCLAAAVVTLAAGHPESTPALLFNLGSLAAGGIVLGVVTGGTLLWFDPSTT